MCVRSTLRRNQARGKVEHEVRTYHYEKPIPPAIWPARTEGRYPSEAQQRQPEGLAEKTKTTKGTQIVSLKK